MRDDKELLVMFLKKVKDMREAQTNFFKTRRTGTEKESRDWLVKSKALESEVDQFIKSAEKDKSLPSLFD
jgi:hypothetical protein